MTKTTWWIVGVLVTIAAVAMIFAWRGQKTDTDQSATDADLKTSIPVVTPTPTVAPTAAATTAAKATSTPTVVTYDSKSFSPASVTIEVGDTVTFTNTGSGSMWVGSDPHPNHTDLPAFDSLKGLKKGESYSFTFTKAGSWGYHNHLSSSHKGTVVVVADK